MKPYTKTLQDYVQVDTSSIEFAPRSNRLRARYKEFVTGRNRGEHVLGTPRIRGEIMKLEIRKLSFMCNFSTRRFFLHRFFLVWIN